MNTAIVFARLFVPIALFVTHITATVLAQETVATAPNFSIDWFAMDGGAGTSVGGVYSLSGTIGAGPSNSDTDLGFRVVLVTESQ